MLGIFLLIGIGAGFYGYANKQNMNIPWLWPILGIVSYFAMQFIVGLFIGMLSPSLLYDQGSILLIGLISGFAGVGVCFLIMMQVAKKQALQKATETL